MVILNSRSHLRGFHSETELRNALDQVLDLFQRGPNLERRLLMALQASVQKLIDDVGNPIAPDAPGQTGAKS